MRNEILKASVFLAGLTWVITASFIDFTSWVLPIMNGLSLIYITLFWLANKKTPRTKREQSEVQKGVKTSKRVFYNIVLNGEGGVK